MSIQQGYVTAEPYEIEKQGDFKPNIFLLSDYGYSTYSTLIETRRDIVEKNPDLVQRFVDASAIGWYHYLYGDNSKANAMIKEENPDITDDQIAFSIGEMKKYGVVDSGDTLKLGIGAMTDARWKDFFDKMVETGMVAKRPTTKRPTPCSSSTSRLEWTSGPSESWKKARLARPSLPGDVIVQRHNLTSHGQ